MNKGFFLLAHQYTLIRQTNFYVPSFFGHICIFTSGSSARLFSPLLRQESFKMADLDQF